jgi:hypothetical protein
MINKVIATVINPGFLSTIQDMGRKGFQAFGVPEAGAMDREAALIANLLVSNNENAPLIEVTVMGLQFKHSPLWQQTVPPHSVQRHLSCSFFKNSSIPNSLMNLRFSIMLIWYFVLYRLSNAFNLLQGNFSHSKQNLMLPFARNSQESLMCKQFSPLGMQPGQYFL